ncbi:ABC transporter transmembrane protein [Streptomyces zinciresistens K42]|uniref:ABC transporter transmembrane protein n=1 Tax=Streptomyces zinciresistens K42 TaxID=700597 RepID=G2GDS1_9ACTN|nr:ABC transporter permease subunit [Streptomyces zinciresistens]EGX58339.1 ABC transporter transmembrane protein [Streptomyces zinciresistens K42]
MSSLTSTPTTTRSTAPGTTGTGRLPQLPQPFKGMTWLVWRQHRAAFWTVLGASALAVAFIVFQRSQLHTAGYDSTSTGLRLMPILLGVFLGAPLFAGDLENGTAKLVVTQSASRTRWLTTKLALTALVVVVSTVALSVGFGWWWNLYDESTSAEWTSGATFNNTGPVPAALALFSVFGGVAIGVVLRRTLVAMAVTLGFTVVVQIAWSHFLAHFLLSLASVATITTNKGVPFQHVMPTLPPGAHQVNWSTPPYITGDGKLLGWSTCNEAQTEQAHDLCMKKADVVGWSVDYLPISQMNGLQWFSASILLALTAAVTVLLFFWGRKRLA